MIGDVENLAILALSYDAEGKIYKKFANCSSLNFKIKLKEKEIGLLFSENKKISYQQQLINLKKIKNNVWTELALERFKIHDNDLEKFKKMIKKENLIKFNI